ncbi:MAG: hypothetical protein LQ343_002275 [Gyalolechia ehrenbergii]|nr:MAG: hypothetical protein LQ343_002275 [Gyalolechia ehrenbergii]
MSDDRISIVMNKFEQEIKDIMALEPSPLEARVEDYLNDKLQTAADLESLDSLLVDVKKQQGLLRQQLQEAKENLAENTKASESHSSALRQQAQTYKKQQADIDRRLLIVTQSETSDDAIEKFDADIRVLQKVDVARSYVELLAYVEDLSKEARRNFKSSPQAALQPYLRLQKLAIALKEAQIAAEDAAPHLVDHVDQAAQKLWKQMKDAFANDFEKVLAKMNWPEKNVKLSGSLEQEWTGGVERLLELQEPELDAQNDHVNPSEEPLVLLPIEVMVKPLALRFQYHFSGDRPTNKLDKPEYFLSHIVGLLNQYDEFYAIHFQPILRSRFRNSNLAMTSIFIDSTSALITALLPMLRHKTYSIMPLIAKQPQLLSHFIHELMSFDINLRDEWGYDGGCGIDGWRGLTWEVLVKGKWFDRWLEVEKNFALSRYQSIIDDPSSGEIDYDSVEPSATKPTNGAIRVNDLLETITDRYRPLPSFSQKLRFLIDIQIAIFDLFHARLASSLEAYLTLTSSLSRTVHGVSRDKSTQPDLSGLAGIERLMRVYGSAEYLEKKMRDWSDDVFFLELWEELQDRARANTDGKRKAVAGDMSMEHVADKTSAAVGNEDAVGGALFDETAGHYRQLRVRAEDIMLEQFLQNLRDAIKGYGRVNPWSALSEGEEEDDDAQMAITAELDNTIQLLQSYISFLANALSQAPLRRVARQVALSIQGFLWDHVVMRYTFSAPGARQFQRDVHGIWEIIDRYVGVRQGEMGMKRLREGLVLLRLGGGEALKNGLDGGVATTGELKLTLADVNERLFRSNESGKEALEELGLEVLSEGEARSVLERRVDMSG